MSKPFPSLNLAGLTGPNARALQAIAQHLANPGRATPTTETGASRLLVVSVEDIGATATGEVLLYQTPLDRSLVPLSLVVRAMTYDTVTVNPTLQAGRNSATWNDGVASVTPAFTAVRQMVALTLKTPAVLVAPGEELRVKITTAATATACTLGFDLVGVLIFGR